MNPLTDLDWQKLIANYYARFPRQQFKDMEKVCYHSKTPKLYNSGSDFVTCLAENVTCSDRADIFMDEIFKMNKDNNYLYPFPAFQGKLDKLPATTIKPSELYRKNSLVGTTDVEVVYVGTTTFAYCVEEGSRFIRVSVAHCHPNDKFTKNRGRHVALADMKHGRCIRLRVPRHIDIEKNVESFVISTFGNQYRFDGNVPF